MTLVSGAADKVWMAAGRPPATPDATNLHGAYNLGLQTSTDLGDTWGPTVGLGNGIGFLPRIGPLGEVYVGFWDFGAGVRLRTSLDGGATVGSSILAATRMEIYDTFSTPHLPGEFRAPPLNYLAVDPNTGRLYFVWFDTTSVSGGETEVDLYITQSDNRGATWTSPAVFALPGDQFMPWLEVDETGRMHLLFLDTRHTAQSDGDTVAFIDAYYAYSEDAGATWTEARWPWPVRAPSDHSRRFRVQAQR